MVVTQRCPVVNQSHLETSLVYWNLNSYPGIGLTRGHTGHPSIPSNAEHTPRRHVMFFQPRSVLSTARIVSVLFGSILASLICFELNAKSPSAASSKLSPDLTIRLEQRRKAPTVQYGESFAAIVRLTAPPTEALITAWESKGIHFERRNTKLVSVGSFYGVIITENVVDFLSAQPEVVAIFPPVPRMVSPIIDPGPLTKVHEIITTIPTWGLKDKGGVDMDGTGVTLVDIDSGIDVFHPLFFRPDGGFYSWIDTNGNGQLDPEIDAADLDANGVADVGETLLSLGGDLIDVYTGAVIEPAGERFVPGQMYLYADTNSNRKRDHGKAKGFDDGSLAFGEPLFIYDDVNRNKISDLGEKLVRLGTSKIRGVYAVGSGKTYERGVNLSEFVVSVNASHGTGVAGILVGGVIGHTDVVGVAPGAELLMLDSSSINPDPNFDWNASILSGFAWAKEHGARVFVHEYGSQFGNRTIPRRRSPHTPRAARPGFHRHQSLPPTDSRHGRGRGTPRAHSRPNRAR